MPAALLLAQCMAARGVRTADQASVKALAAIEDRIQEELKRLTRIDKHAKSIVRSGEEIADEVRKAEKALTKLLRSANDVLVSLATELDDFSSEERVCATDLVEAIAAEE